MKWKRMSGAEDESFLPRFFLLGVIIYFESSMTFCTYENLQVIKDIDKAITNMPGVLTFVTLNILDIWLIIY